MNMLTLVASCGTKLWRRRRSFGGRREMAALARRAGRKEGMFVISLVGSNLPRDVEVGKRDCKNNRW